MILQKPQLCNQGQICNVAYKKFGIQEMYKDFILYGVLISISIYMYYSN